MPSPERLGRYAIYDEIASGGMATVHFGRLIGGEGFSRRVAIKRMYPQFSKDPDFVEMFLDEARLSARIHHPNVVQTLDVVRSGEDLSIVMEYVHGESLSRLLRRVRETEKNGPSLGVSLRLVLDVLNGLEAAHGAKSETGTPLGIVHRDVSPQNVLVGADGLARLIDFGIAKAKGRMRTTPSGQVKGKLAYMAPEQVKGEAITPQSDLYAVTVLLWELLTGRRLFGGETDAQTLALSFAGKVPPPSSLAEVPRELDEIVARGTMRDPRRRFALASEMAARIDALPNVAKSSEVRRFIADVAGDVLAERERRFVEVESRAVGDAAPSPEVVIESASALAEARPIAARDEGTRTTSVGEVHAPPGKKRGVLLGAAAVLLLGLVGGALLFSRSSIRPGPAASAAPSASIVTSAPELKISAPPEASNAALAPSASSTRRTLVPARSPAPARPKKANCNPPYYVDSDGIQQIKRECL